ncbi:ferric reductase transmembrane component 4 precursor [Niveomyces insectorum RCEF 264]|uniref:Ferric reductase transmembrane component 4 n=1 Tax=Niveomyces insectorum RCEF 264 TaxID=1081102 RepID=A0A167URW2_9HYPO|nr:ferric reductase transmembrane component 4 precursor [Niveomyces insectorum RCEF 264]
MNITNFIAALLGLWLVSLRVAWADQTDRPVVSTYCFHVIYMEVGVYTFEPPSKASDGSSGTKEKRAKAKIGKGACNQEIEAVSLYAAAVSYCSPSQLAATVPYWQSLCKAAGTPLMDVTDIVARTTKEYAATLPRLNPNVNKTSKTITEPVLLDESYYRLVERSDYTNDWMQYKHLLYGWGIFGFWAGILVLGMLQKAYASLWVLRRSRTLVKGRGDAEQAGVTSTTKAGAVHLLWHRLRTWLVIPAGLAPLSHRHQQYILWATIPRRLDLLIVVAYWIILIVLCFVGYESFPENTRFNSTGYENFYLAASRAGILAYASLPMLYLFGGRNNIFLWATNFSFRSFVIFHRNIAVAVTLLLISHAICYTVQYKVYTDKYIAAHVQNYFYMGVIALVSLCLLCVSSHRWVRQKYYEVFLVTHVVLGILVAYGAVRHVQKTMKNYMGHLWPVAGVWLFDRTVRIARILYCNIRVARSKRVVKTPSSIVRYIPDANLIEITVTAATQIPRAGPGQHYYLYQPFTLRGWENHPFSLAAFGPATAAGADSGEQQLVFFARPHDGWTRRLQKQCQAAPEHVIQPQLFIEGPYGHRSPVHLFDTVVLVAGGSGITSALPYVLEHVRRAGVGRTKTTKLQLVWSTRQRAMIDYMTEGVLQPALVRSDFEPVFNCTDSTAVGNNEKKSSRQQRNSAFDEKSPVEQETQLRSDLVTASDSDSAGATHAVCEAGDKAIAQADVSTPSSASSVINERGSRGVLVSHARPDVCAHIAALVEQAKQTSSTIAVLVCGPSKMADDTRRAVFEAMRGGFLGIEYFEETFGW